MKKRLLLIFTSLFSIITLAIGIVSFSYAWLAQEPEYHFTLTTGDYPLLVKSNLYTTSFECTDRQVNPDGSANTNLDYLDPKLRLTKERYKSFDYSENKINISPETGKTDASGILTLSFKALTKNILDETSKLSIIGNSSNGYALNNKYFYVAFIEFLFVKEFFDAYFICNASSNTTSSFFKYTFLDSVQTVDPANNKLSFINISKDTDNPPNEVSLNDPIRNVDDLFNSTPKQTLTDIYDTDTNKSKKITSLATKIGDEICYTYAVVYGIYVDPTILLSKNTTALEGTLSLSFEFTLSDSSIAYV